MTDKNETIRRAVSADSGVLAELANKMWINDPIDELEAEFAELTRDGDAACFLKYADGRPVAFAQCGLRHDYVEGTDSSPVGYLEGIFVLPQYRGQGIASELLFCCEAWAKQKGCTEFASDCELTNAESLRFHEALGFTEVNRLICFKKSI